MKALDYAIRTENWELAALCLVVGALEAVKELPPDVVDEMLAMLDVELGDGDRAERAPPLQVGEECGPRRHERARGDWHGG